jgi:hypothetical protein
MSIPLVRNNTKDAINTSIIAIKKNLERINTLLGLVDSSEPDLSGLATKQELEDTVTEINDTIDEVETSLQPVDTVTSGNIHSVTSNAVAKISSYDSTQEHFIGYYSGKPMYRKLFIIDGQDLPVNDTASYTLPNEYSNRAVIFIKGGLSRDNFNYSVPLGMNISAYIINRTVLYVNQRFTSSPSDYYLLLWFEYVYIN